MGRKRRKVNKAMGARAVRRSSSGNLFTSTIFLRIAAFVCDYLLMMVATVIITMLPLFYVTGGGVSTSLADYISVGIPQPVIVALVLVAVALSWVYFAFLPATSWQGQTLGKRWTKTEVVLADGTRPSLAIFTLRWLFMLFVETPSIFVAIDLEQLLGLWGLGAVVSVWQVAGGLALMASFIMMLGTTYHVALHDRVLGTWVWNGN